MKKQIKYTWQELERDIKKLAKLKDEFEIKNIYGIPRGGLVPAIMLSHKMKKPLILDPGDISNLTLIVDDISDSGQILNDLLKPFKNRLILPKMVTLWVCKGTKTMPDAYIRVKSKDQWIQYPWE